MISNRSDALSGVLLVDKPRGMTSHDVVDRVRKLAHTRRVGHAGTLDPMADGLLLICIGPATRVVQFLTGLSKEYSGIIRLGAISSTYDAEGSITAQEQPIPRDPDLIREVMQHQVGCRTQLPPPFSAIKVNGKKLYEYARRGEEIPLKPRRVMIHHFRMVEFLPPEIKFHARVGSGTYIRSMAHDLGIELECGAYLTALRRETVGHFHVDDSVTLAALIENPALLEERLMGISQGLGHLPRIVVAPHVEKEILNGRGFTTHDILSCEMLPQVAEDSVVVNVQGKVLSIVRGEPIDPITGRSIDIEHDEGESEPMEAVVGQVLYFRPVRVLGRE